MYEGLREVCTLFTHLFHSFIEPSYNAGYEHRIGKNVTNLIEILFPKIFYSLPLVVGLAGHAL